VLRKKKTSAHEEELSGASQQNTAKSVSSYHVNRPLADGVLEIFAMKKQMGERKT
jgi:hypothetical protein